MTKASKTESNSRIVTEISRRDMLRILGISAGAVVLPTFKSAAAVYIEEYPTSPLILTPFKDALPLPAPAIPLKAAELSPGGKPRWATMPQQAVQDCYGNRHQIWPSKTTAGLNLPAPLIYDIKLQVAQKSFTTSRVLPINSLGQPVRPPAGAPVTVAADGTTTLPKTTIYGFNGTFPGPMIVARYGQPVLVRFQNFLADNPLKADRGNFGDPNLKFLTHCHNGHTAPESDGNPYHLPQGGYHASLTPGVVGGWVDNLYLNYPAGNDSNHKQSFLWFHDHTHGHTGANVYKGMVGLMPIFDPVLDPGDETKGLRLPGVPKYVGGKAANGIDYNQRIDYDIPLALYDCCFDDGVTKHKDIHTGAGETHPEWWGTTFFKHLPNHGFVGDVFTVNGTAYPTITVSRRRYRLRFLGASVARQFELSFMASTGGPKPSLATTGPDGKLRTGKALQGQYQLPDGRQCMIMTQIASEGGLLPYPIIRDKVEIWPANRKEVIVDFSKYMDGTPTTTGDVIYLVNTAVMSDGRKMSKTATTVDDAGNIVPDPNFDPTYRVPILKIVIGANATDNSLEPLNYKTLVNGKATLATTAGVPNLKLRPAPVVPKDLTGVPRRTFELQRGGTYGGEIEWLINGHAFDRADPNGEFPQAIVKQGVPELWVLRNGGGGWSHPMHMHQEEHMVVSRNGIPCGSPNYDPRYVDECGKQDVVNLDGGSEVVIYRNFRMFKGKYVAHCHNLAHEDHSMFFAWEIA